MRLTTKGLLNTLIEAIQEKKGRDIVVTDFSQIDGSMCRYFIICQGGSPAHIQAIANSVTEFTRVTPFDPAESTGLTMHGK